MNNNNRNESLNGVNVCVGGTNAFNEQSPTTNNTLKHRIKRAMAMECEDLSEVHISSVLAAASALASLGERHERTPPSTPENSAAAEAAGGKQLTIEQIVGAGNSRGLPPELDHDVPMTFPQKLMEILSNSQVSDIITWLPTGKGFIILQKRRFAAEVMPLYFKHSKFTSFTRKLNRWGFTRVTRGPESGAYYHKYFQRGEHNLCMQMHCQSSKVPSKEPSLRASSPAITSITSPGVATAMSSLRLEESCSPNVASGPPLTNRPPFKTSFSTNNPNIFAPDLTRQEKSSSASSNNQGAIMNDTRFVPSMMKRSPFGLNLNQQQLQMQAQMGRQQMSSSQPPFGCSTLQHAKLIRFNQSQSFGYEKTQISGMNSASSRQHPFVIQAAMNALRRAGSATQHQMSDQVMNSFNRPGSAIQHQMNDQASMNAFNCPGSAIQHHQVGMNVNHHPESANQHNMRDQASLNAICRPENVTRPEMSDQTYLDMLRANEGSQSNSFVSALGAALGSPEDTQKMIKEAMQAQMRNFEERNRTVSEAKPQARVEQVFMPVSAKPSASKSDDKKSNLHMTQGQVAHLRQKLANNGNGGQPKEQQERYPRAVRRASAA